MLRDSVVALVVVRTRPRAIPLALVTMRKSIHGFPVLSKYGYGAPLGAPLLDEDRKRDSRLSAYRGVVLQRFDSTKVCLGTQRRLFKSQLFL